MKLDLIQKADEAYAKEKLDKYYANNLLPAEKKLYLTELKSSHGPYMGIEGSDGKPHYLMDAASQIATLGLGFNSSVFLGPAHHLEAWTNENHTPNVESVRKGFEAFLKRKTGWNSLHTTFCNSGAEANEIALGYCFRNRKNKNAKKVLAFEGSFHGRMLVSLQATWNPSKREPFLFPGFECSFVPFPELDSDVVHQTIPSDWRDSWEKSTAKDFKTPTQWDKDPQTKEEVRCLKEVRSQLLSGEIFSVIVETMQCEGGDRYSSDRFHTALLLMARSFGVGVIHDEVQTGFHLGRNFFWHKMLELKEEDGTQLNPNYVVCAKKAQIGIVISHGDETLINQGPEEYSVVSMIRGYLHGVALDQAQKNIINLEHTCRERLDDLIKKYSDHIARPRLMGMSFAFDLLDKSKVMPFIGARFEHGLLYYPAGDKTLRFRLNTAYTEKDLNFLFERLEQIVIQVLVGGEANHVTNVETTFRTPDNLYSWHELIVTHRLLALQGNAPTSKSAFIDCEKLLVSKNGLEGAKLVSLTKANFNEYKDQIWSIQEEVYEPTRQTSLETFEKAFSDDNAVALLLIKNEKVEAMAISGTMANFPTERILRRDPDFDDIHSLYMVDCTVRPGHQGKGLGRQIKSALNLMAMAEDKSKIVGRNRDRLAGAMLSINLGLGAKEELYVPEDYPDFEEHRDVFYYNNDLKWDDSNYRLDSGIYAPLDSHELDEEYLKEQLPFLTNKICLSNFVSLRYLDHFKELFSQLPKELQHGYSASGQSECVDKLSKAMFVAESEENNTRHKMVSFKDHYFGLGSFMSRSLSTEGDNYFPVDHFNSPTTDNWKEVLAALKKNVDAKETLAIWIEPLPQNTLQPVPKEFLIELRKWTTDQKINLVFNDTASSLYRYDESSFCASTIDAIKPDAGFIFMGGQAAMVFANENNFLEKPLMMISTWDGDEFSYAAFSKALESIKNNQEDFSKTRAQFSEKLLDLFKENNITEVNMHNGSGTVTGDIPHSLTKLMTPLGNGRYKFIPSFGAMKKFIERF